MQPGVPNKPFVPPGRKPLTTLTPAGLGEAGGGAAATAGGIGGSAVGVLPRSFAAPHSLAPQRFKPPGCVSTPALEVASILDTVDGSVPSVAPATRPVAQPFAQRPALAQRPAYVPPAARTVTPGTAGSSAARGGASSAPVDTEYYSVGYCAVNKVKKRKNKVFMDGVLQVRGALCTLYNSDGKKVTSSAVKDAAGMPDGAELALGKWDVEVAERIEESRFLSGAAFLAPAAAAASAAPRPLAPLNAAPFRTVGSAAAAPRPPPAPLHDPGAPDALVLCVAGDPKLPSARVAVVVDPYIAGRLREHQRIGVRFLFECVMGMRGAHTGALLCDAMGLGKTVQVLALLWTLLRQSPGGGPALRRALVVCPASLVDNWKAEATKWLGSERLGCLALRAGGAAVKEQAAEWANPAQCKWPLLITSYETLRTIAEQVTAAKPGIVICDEGHRLKNSGGSKTLQALRGLGASKRVILTGTPVQNNLGELSAMVEFVCPGLLGGVAEFRRLFELPVAASRDRSASADAKRLGAERQAMLGRMIEPFLLRRTASVNAQYLPPRTDYVVFCRPSALQDKLYKAMLKLPEMASTVRGRQLAGSLETLPALTLIRRLCNAPSALFADSSAADDAEAAVTGCVAQKVLAQLRPLCPPCDDGLLDHTQAGKLCVLASILTRVAAVPGNRVVIVSGWTATLSMIGALCDSMGMGTSRLDGATSADLRHDIVRRFNGGGGGSVFLLSLLAGGVGLNLVGANRLVLYDTSWNPAHDQQAMGRIWCARVSRLALPRAPGVCAAPANP